MMEHKYKEVIQVHHLGYDSIMPCVLMYNECRLPTQARSLSY